MCNQIPSYEQCKFPWTPHLFNELCSIVRCEVSFDVIEDYYGQKESCNFRLILRNGLKLSVAKDGHDFYELMEIRQADNKVTKYPRFLDHDGFGVETILPENLWYRVRELSEKEL